MIAANFSDLGKLPLASTRLNFSVSTEPFQHSIKFCVPPPSSDDRSLLSTLRSHDRGNRKIKLTLKDSSSLKDESTFKNTNSAKAEPQSTFVGSDLTPIGANVSMKSNLSQNENNHADSSPLVNEFPNNKLFETTAPKLSLPPHSSPELKQQHALKVNCLITESLQSTEKSQVTEKFELTGSASASLVGDRSALTFNSGHDSCLGLSFEISDSRSVINGVVSANKAVKITESTVAQSRTVRAAIACSDINAVLTTAGNSPTSSLPPIPVLRYSVSNTFRPMVMRTRTVLSVVGEGELESTTVVKIQVHVLINGRVVTSRLLRDMLIQVSCTPLLLLAGSTAASPVGVQNVTIGAISSGGSTSGPQSAYNSATKVITWVCGDADIKQTSTVSVDATVQVPSGSLDLSALTNTHLPTIVKGLCDDLLISTADIVCAPHSAEQGEDGVTTEVVATKRQTRLECRFL